MLPRLRGIELTIYADILMRRVDDDTCAASLTANDQGRYSIFLCSGNLAEAETDATGRFGTAASKPACTN
jgi:hypothetical protein